jgi:hypothetical protein
MQQLIKKSTIVGYAEFQQVLILLNYVWRFEYKIPPAKKIEVSVPRCTTKICHHTLSVCLCPFSYRFIFHKPLIKQAGLIFILQRNLNEIFDTIL